MLSGQFWTSHFLLFRDEVGFAVTGGRERGGAVGGLAFWASSGIFLRHPAGMAPRAINTTLIARYVGLVPPAESPNEQTSEMKRIVVSSIVGTAVEWYDFLIYGTASALVFNKLFFPLSNPTLGTIAAFGTYGVGFLARPLGAAIFGHFGDRVGRKAMLAMTIVIMGLGTFLVGLLPTYSQIGILAPVLLVLLRLLQGIGLGGEWAGAVLMVVENAPATSRGFLGSMVQLGYPIGNVAAIGALALLSQLPEADFLAWGWRIPFLISILLAGVGLYIRVQLEGNAGLPRD